MLEPPSRIAVSCAVSMLPRTELQYVCCRQRAQDGAEKSTRAHSIEQRIEAAAVSPGGQSETTRDYAHWGVNQINGSGYVYTVAHFEVCARAHGTRPEGDSRGFEKAAGGRWWLRAPIASSVAFRWPERFSARFGTEQNADAAADR